MAPVLEAKNLAKTYETGGASYWAFAASTSRSSVASSSRSWGRVGAGSRRCSISSPADRPRLVRSGSTAIASTGLADRSRAPPSAQGRLRVPVLQPGADAYCGRQRRAAVAPGRPPAQRGTPVRDELLERSWPSWRARSRSCRAVDDQQQRLRWRERCEQVDIILARRATATSTSAAARDVLGLLSENRGTGERCLLVTHDASVASAADR